MPVYNSAKYLRTSIESILNQTFQDFEFIIIDDSSTDASRKIINSYAQNDKRIVQVRNKTHSCTSKSLNHGLSVAKGKYVVRMDADDYSYSGRLEKQFLFMESHPEVGVSGGAIEVCDEKLKVRYVRHYPLSDKELRKIIFLYSPFAHPATIWDRELMVGVGGYNENIPLSQDAELYFRIGRISNFGNIKDTLIKLRIHGSSSSMSKDTAQERYAIYARIKAIIEYGYPVRFVDWLYIIFRIVAMVTVPTKIKFWLFNLLRREE